MKTKSLLMIGLAGLLTTGLKAQEQPAAGDWGLSINASPFLNYVGNMFNGGGFAGANTAPVWAGTAQNPASISARYFTSDDMAYRAILGIGMTSTSTNVPAGANSYDTKTSATSWNLGAGLEKKKAHSRIVGTYGGGLMLSSSAHPAGNTTVDDPNNYGPGSSETTGGSTMGIGVMAWLGAEYFVTDRLSIGGEYNFAIMSMSTAERSTTAGGTTTVTSGKSSGMSISTPASGSLQLNIYF